jgi:hypothetical protein
MQLAVRLQAQSFPFSYSVVIGQQGSAGPTFSVGTGNKLGLNHRLFNQNTTVKVYTARQLMEL